MAAPSRTTSSSTTPMLFSVATTRTLVAIRTAAASVVRIEMIT